MSLFLKKKKKKTTVVFNPEGTGASKSPSSTKELWDWETIAKVKQKGPLHALEIYRQAREPTSFLFN